MADSMILFVIIGILVILGLVVSLLAVKSKKKMKPDYYAMFIIGLFWLPFGIIMMFTDNSVSSVFFILGIVYFITGLLHKDEWKKNHKTWKGLTDRQKQLKIFIIVLLTMILIGGVVAYFIVK